MRLPDRLAASIVASSNYGRGRIASCWRMSSGGEARPLATLESPLTTVILGEDLRPEGNARVLDSRFMKAAIQESWPHPRCQLRRLLLKSFLGPFRPSTPPSARHWNSSESFNYLNPERTITKARGKTLSLRRHHLVCFPISQKSRDVGGTVTGICG